MPEFYIDTHTYHKWIDLNDTIGACEEKQIREEIDGFQSKPVISIIMPVYNTVESHLTSAIRSVQNQVYPYWELCIADDASSNPAIRRILNAAEQKDSRIKLVLRSENGNISAASNSALKLATGDFLALMDHDDVIPKHALFHIAEEINRHPDASLIYSDSDRLDELGNRCNPYFKPAWNYDLFLSHNYITHLSVYRHKLVKQLEGFREGLEGSQDYDLALRAIEKIPADRIVHIPKILYHWRIVDSSFSRSRLREATLKAREAIREHLTRKAYKAKVATVPGKVIFHRIRWELSCPPPKVTMIVDINGPPIETQRWIKQLFDVTSYSNIEIFIVTAQNSKLQMTEVKGIRCSAITISNLNSGRRTQILNEAFRRSSADAICLVEKYFSPKGPDWLAELVSHVMRKDVGLVGAKISTSDGIVSHSGVILALSRFVDAVWDGHPSTGRLGCDQGYFSNLIVTRCVSCVSGGCWAIKKAAFDEIGGFDENLNIPIFRDIDVSLKIKELGLSIIWCANCELIVSSADRLLVSETRDLEIACLKDKWRKQLDRDGYYNCNFNHDSGDYTLSVRSKRVLN